MSNKIKHAGVVDAVEEGCVRVRILQSSACSACKVAAHCNASETKEKLIEVMDAHASCFQKGDHVMVVADTAVGFLDQFLHPFERKEIDLSGKIISDYIDVR